MTHSVKRCWQDSDDFFNTCIYIVFINLRVFIIFWINMLDFLVLIYIFLNILVYRCNARCQPFSTCDGIKKKNQFHKKCCTIWIFGRYVAIGWQWFYYARRLLWFTWKGVERKCCSIPDSIFKKTVATARLQCRLERRSAKQKIVRIYQVLRTFFGNLETETRCPVTSGHCRGRRHTFISESIQ